MKLYLFEKSPSERVLEGNTDRLVFRVLKEYCAEENLVLKCEPKILRQDSGKPVFDREGIYFSVSHSGDLWGCLMGNRPVGLDIQKRRTASWENIAEHFFTREEKKYVEEKGETGFWKIWVLKESYVKFLGTTLARGMSEYSLVEDGNLLHEIHGATLKLIEMDLGYYGACAYTGQEEICKRKLK